MNNNKLFQCTKLYLSEKIMLSGVQFGGAGFFSFQLNVNFSIDMF